MQDILATIDDTLERKGLSVAVASRIAIANPSLIENIGSETKVNKQFNAEALRKLAEVLDPEFYFSEHREETSLPLPDGF